MILSHVWGIFSNPDNEWKNIRSEPNSLGKHYLSHTLILAAIPALCGYYGVTNVGWTIGKSDTIYRLTSESAIYLFILFYFAMIVGVIILGKFVDFLSLNFRDGEHTKRGIVLATYTTAPLFVCGFVALYPVLWLDMLAGLIAVAYSTYLLYEGVPILMNIPKERGFVFASAIVTIGLVMFIGLMAITIIIWAIGVGPIYTSS